VLDALTTGQWPGRGDTELRSHATVCPVCSDLVEVFCPLREAQDSAWHDARVPSSAVMWWRAQMRARQEAARQAARPITVAQVIGSVTALVLAAILLAALSPWLREWMVRIGDDLLNHVDLQAAMLARGWLIPALVVGLWLVLAPLAVYFAVSDD